MAGTQERKGYATDNCASFETEQGEVVFYDRENADAWIQSDYAIDFADVRAVGPSD